MMISLAVVIIWLGLFPNSVLKISASPVQKVIEKANRADIANLGQTEAHKAGVNSLAIIYSH
jgi:NADH:ubiquinone oxidoreductase subunit 4 (subunit M)